MSRIFFCANQVSLCIAISLLNNKTNYCENVIFYDDSRCDIYFYKSKNVKFIQYTKWNFFKFLIRCFFKKPDEVIVPHFRGSRLVKFYAKYAKKLSAIDDGLDTFRETPKNICIKDFKPASNYYTFTYNIELASWINQFNLVKVCDLKEIAKSSKKTIDLNHFDLILIESPGVESVKITDITVSKILVIKHANPIKNNKFRENYTSIIGSEFALENSITNFKGTLIIGESMTAVFALMLELPTFHLKINIHEENKKNLLPLMNLITKNNA